MLLNVYFGCAAAGGAVLVLQTLAQLLGAGHHDADAGIDDVHDGASHGGHHGGHHGAADGDAFVKLFTLKTVVAFLTFFGLAGLAAERAGTHPASGFVLALLAGGIALYGVAWLMKTLAGLQSRGNVSLERAVGESGTVYLQVPANGEGQGKVTLALQGRTVELKAVSRGPALPTGASVRIVALRSPDVVEVAAADAV